MKRLKNKLRDMINYIGFIKLKFLCKFSRISTLYQYYTTIDYATPRYCLLFHGKIYRDLDTVYKEIPAYCLKEYGELLEFPLNELKYYWYKGLSMRGKSQYELLRRRLFQEGEELLMTNPQEALNNFSCASRVEVYISEIEVLFREYREGFVKNRALFEDLTEVFLKSYEEKFRKEKYSHFPMDMKENLKISGEKRIKELSESILKGDGICCRSSETLTEN